MGDVRRLGGGQGAVAGKILTWHTNTSTGYPTVRLSHDGRSVGVNVHRLVANAFLGPRPDGLETRHLDGNQMNCRANNLAYGTHQENGEDKVRHGTSSAGERNPRAKITAAIAEQIRAKYASGAAAKDLARNHGLHKSSVFRIVAGVRWASSNRAIDRKAESNA